MVDYPDGGDEERWGDIEAAGEGIDRIQVKIVLQLFREKKGRRKTSAHDCSLKGSELGGDEKTTPRPEGDGQGVEAPEGVGLIFNI